MDDPDPKPALEVQRSGPAGSLHPRAFPAPPFEDHALLDSGEGEKLERFGPVVLRRPDPQAVWYRRRPSELWDAAHLSFERDPASGGRRGTWVPGTRATKDGPGCLDAEQPAWPVSWRGASFVIRPTPFKHVGLFPEQAANWAWIEELAPRFAGEGGGAQPRLLNLFGYTGAASVVAARAGFEVTHVDASRTSIAWARENAEASGLGERALRVVLDDALAFARREVRRGSTYEGLLLDPPHHGRGPKGETWQFEQHFAPLVEACRQLLAPRSFLVLSTYAIGFSPLAFENVLADLEGGRTQVGELVLPHEALPGEPGPPRLLPCGFCARWWRGLEPA